MTHFRSNLKQARCKINPAGARWLVAACLVAICVLTPTWTAEAQGSAESPEKTFLTRVRQLTFEGRRAGEGYFSADGSSMVFQSEREPGNPFFQVYLLDLATGDSRRVSPGQGKTTCPFIRPNSSEILFGSTHHDPRSEELQAAEFALRESGNERRYSWDYDPEMEIWTANEAGELTRLTHERGYDAEGSYSPDGEWIVFASTRDGYNRELSAEEAKQLELNASYFGEIYIMRADGSGQRRLTTVDGYDGGPFFFPDGSRIIWRRFDTEGLTAEIWSMKLDGSDQRPLTEFGAMSWAPYVHPSGEYVLFASNKLGFANFEIYMVDVEGRKEPVRVTHTDGFDGLPVPTPDGRKLAWTSTRHQGDGGQIFLADWNHEAARQALGAASSRVAEGDSLVRHVERLASDELEGRLTGTEGERLAADYIVAELEKVGVKPLAGQEGLRLPFDFTAGTKDVGTTLSLSAGADQESFSGTDRVQALSFSESGQITGEVIFAGYGLVVPESQGFEYDSYATLDVEGKIVLALRYFPEDMDQESRSKLARYSGLRYKALQARERGAKALIVVTGPNSPNGGEVIPMAFDTASSGSGIVAASIDGQVGERLFEFVTDKTLEQAQKALDDGNPHAVGFEIPGVELTLEVKVEREGRVGYNVLGVLPGTASSDDLPVVIIGAHYDHLGHGRAGNSLASKEEAGAIHHGADDNASGVAAVLEAAAQLSTMKHRRDIFFAFWSGEELGLLGSSGFVNGSVFSQERTAAYINLDMVGQMRDNKLVVQAAGSSTAWGGLVERTNVAVGFDVQISNDPYLPTDSTAFNGVSVPTLNLFTGSHEDYHRPSDTADKINYEDLERVARFAALIAAKVANLDAEPDFVKVEPKMTQGGGRDTLRAFTGTIPDYASEIEGLLLSGVIGGGPAEEAGLQGGDVIVEFGGQKIANIYDYTYALDAVKVGQPVQVIVERDGERHELTLVPRARK